MEVIKISKVISMIILTMMMGIHIQKTIISFLVFLEITPYELTHSSQYFNSRDLIECSFL